MITKDELKHFEYMINATESLILELENMINATESLILEFEKAKKGDIE